MENEEIEAQYLDVLQNIEFAIVQVDQQADDLTDMEVADALDALMRSYQAEASGRAAPFQRLSPLKRQVYDSVKTMCDWRLGKQPPSEETDLPAVVEKRGPDPEPTPPEAILACLKRVRLSVKRWNGSNGRRGYLEFVSNFVR
jgi:hypothetical protein